MTTLLMAWPCGAPPALRRLAKKLAAVCQRPLATSGQRRWLARTVEAATEVDSSDASGVYEALLWAHCLPWLAGELPPGAIQELADRLRSRAMRWPRGLAEVDFYSVLASTELPLALAANRPGPETEALGRRGLAGLESWISLVSDLGMLPARALPFAPALAASWLRSRKLIEPARLGGEGANLDRGAILVREALRAGRRDGQSLFGQCESTPALRRWLIESAQSLDGSLRLLARDSGSKRGGRGAAIPAPSVSQAKAQAAVLRDRWSSDSHAAAIRYEGRDVRIELLAAGRPLVTGPWTTTVVRDGRPLAAASDWEQVCYETDEGGEYLELGLDLADGWCLERHLFLPRGDGALLIADVLLGESPADLQWQLTLPLAPGIAATAEPETHDVRIGFGRVLPLTLPEWRLANSPGGLAVGEGRVDARIRARGSRLLFPLWIDFDPARRTHEATWRQLTVAEDRKICEADCAQAFRIQVGRKQWLFYRSLAARASRTVLGQNLVYETAVGRLTPKGGMDRLIEIE